MTYSLQRCISIGLLILSTTYSSAADFNMTASLSFSPPGDLSIEKLQLNPVKPPKVPHFAEKMTRSFQHQSAHHNIYVPHGPQPSFRSESIKEYKPIRIIFSTSQLMPIRQASLVNRKRIDAIIYSILPETNRIWTSHLSVIPKISPIGMEADTCFGEATIPSEHVLTGVDDADLVIFVNVVDCEGSGALAFAFPCSLDAYNDRPVIGNMYFCLDSIDVENGKVPSATVKNGIEVAVHEVGHVLGVNSDLLPYYRSKDNKPFTHRPFQPSTVTCLDGTRKNLILPANNTLRAVSSGGRRHFEIVTERVKIVVRNQFNCPYLEGARLENQPTNPQDCFGSHWDERYFYTETMGAVYAKVANSNILSPLTLALLEDTGWYKANYENSTVSSFGHLAGCEFVNKKCIEDGQVPSHSKGFYCNKPLEFGDDGSIRESYSMCDPTLTNVALCDLVNHALFENTKRPPKDFRYFFNPNLGPMTMIQADYCPIANINLHSCQGQPRADSLPFETYGLKSNCMSFEFSSKGQKQEHGFCLRTKCDEESHTLKVFANGISVPFICKSDGQKIQIPGYTGLFFLCPRLAVVCPNMICPANCSGRGVCDHSGKKPKCNCFDERDRTAGCYGYDPTQTFPPTLKPTTPPTSTNAQDGTASGSPGLISLLSKIMILSIASTIELLLALS